MIPLNQIKAKRVTCPICGEMDLEKYYVDSDMATLIPTYYAPTSDDYIKMHDELFGESYEQITGIPPSETNIRKGTAKFSHMSDEDDGREAAKAHRFTEPIEYWTDN